jgi:hypothetical protein
MQRRLLVVLVVVFAVLGAIALAVRDHHSSTRGTFGTSTTTTFPNQPTAVPSTSAPSQGPLARVILCTETSPEPECRRDQSPNR